jgi:hypothetical protein
MRFHKTHSREICKSPGIPHVTTARPPVEQSQVDRPGESKEEENDGGPQDDCFGFGRHEFEIYQSPTIEEIVVDS